MLAVDHDGHLGLDGKAGRFDVDPAQVLAVDRVDLGGDVGRGGVTHRRLDDLGEVELEQVGVVLAFLGEAGVVGVEPEHGAVVGDADQQGSAGRRVEECGDGLERGRLEWLEDLAAVGVGAERRLVLDRRGLSCGQQVADRDPLLAGDLGGGVGAGEGGADQLAEQLRVVEQLVGEVFVGLGHVEHGASKKSP